MRKIFIIFILTFFSYIIHADGMELKSKKDTQVFSNEVMKLINDNRVSDAFIIIGEVMLVSDKKISELEKNTLEQLKLIKKAYGENIEYKLIKEEKIDDFIIKYTYVIKNEYNITRWIFIFYKPKDKWILSIFKWDDDITKLF